MRVCVIYAHRHTYKVTVYRFEKSCFWANNIVLWILQIVRLFAQIFLKNNSTRLQLVRSSRRILLYIFCASSICIRVAFLPISGFPIKKGFDAHANAKTESFVNPYIDELSTRVWRESTGIPPTSIWNMYVPYIYVYIWNFSRGRTKLKWYRLLFAASASLLLSTRVDANFLHVGWNCTVALSSNRKKIISEDSLWNSIERQFGKHVSLSSIFYNSSMYVSIDVDWRLRAMCRQQLEARYSYLSRCKVRYSRRT